MICHSYRKTVQASECTVTNTLPWSTYVCTRHTISKLGGKVGKLEKSTCSIHKVLPTKHIHTQ
jgi:hypothetical protein